MSDRVALKRTTALSRLAIAGFVAAFLGGCSAESLRLDGLTSSFSNPFSSLTGGGDATGSLGAPASASSMRGQALSAAKSNFASAATTSPSVGNVARFQPPVTGGERGWSATGGTPLVVANGESASVLSQRYGVPESALLSANGFSSASQLTPGTRIMIPVYNAGAARSAASAAANSAPTSAVLARPAPVAAAPVAAKPVAAKPVAANPVAAKPVAAKPSFTPPVVEKPVAARPVPPAPIAKAGPDPEVARHIAEAKAAKARAEDERLRLAKAREEARQAQARLDREKSLAASEARSRADAGKAAARKAEIARLEAKAKEAKLAEQKAAESRQREKAALEAKIAKVRAEEARAKARASEAQSQQDRARAAQAKTKAEQEAKAKAEKAAREAKAKDLKAREQKMGKAKEAQKTAEAPKPAEKPAEKIAKVEPRKPEPSRQEVARAETPKAEAAKPEASKPETTASLKADDNRASTPSAANGNPEFRWPARGKVIQGFRANGNDGINIAVPEGTSVKAAEGGVVAYAGSELKNLGNLVLIRHPNGYVSAYAHNGELNVKRGEQVKRGQVIAKSGQSGAVQSPQLHFELRKGSTPVDPTQFLAGL